MPRDRGFTLVEIMVAVMIVAVLLAVALVAFRGMRGRAVEVGTKSETRNQILDNFSEQGDYTEAELLMLETLWQQELSGRPIVEVIFEEASDGALCMWQITDTGVYFGTWDPQNTGTTARYYKETAIPPDECPAAADVLADGFTP